MPWATWSANEGGHRRHARRRGSEVGSTSRRHRPQDDGAANQQEGDLPRTVEGLEPGKSYTTNGERVEEGAHRSNLRQIGEDVRIAGQAVVGPTAQSATRKHHTHTCPRTCPLTINDRGRRTLRYRPTSVRAQIDVGLGVFDRHHERLPHLFRRNVGNPTQGSALRQGSPLSECALLPS
jgi:hypothetical protein